MMTKDQATMLATLAVACRPIGAKRWDAPGVIAALAKVNTLHLADVIHATIRAASDATLDTPAAIGNTASPSWRAYLDSRTLTTSGRQVRADERCNDCGKPETHPLHPGDHPFEHVHRTDGDPTAAVDHLRNLLRNATDRTATEGASS